MLIYMTVLFYPMDINSIPSYKRISFTKYVVDCFYIDIINASHYFLSHFHADHYYGLKKSFSHPIYCSVTTANLLELKYKCKTHPLENNKIYFLESNSTVFLTDAHHCPGAVCFIFCINGSFVLHTGDFRCTYDFTLELMKYNFTTIFLDNTFEGFRAFPTQEEVIHKVLDIIRCNNQRKCLVPIKYKYLFCTYMIGKEKIFLCVAHFFNMSIKLEPDKMKIYQCYDKFAVDLLNAEVEKIVSNYREKLGSTKEPNNGIPLIKRTIIPVINTKENNNGSRKKSKSESLLKYCRKPLVLKEITNKENSLKETEEATTIQPFSRITTEKQENQIMVISTQHIEKKRLHKILDNVKADRVTVFCGTGWQDKTVSFDWLKSDGRKVKKGIDIVHVPYSEHSSSVELEYFMENMKYERIVNTVKRKSKNEVDVNQIIDLD